MSVLTENEIFQLAEQFLKSINANIVLPGEFGREEGDRIEVIYILKEALEPGVVMDPPDICVWVNTRTKEVELIHQM